jgi:putative ABC transport system substrate-binding protein
MMALRLVLLITLTVGLLAAPRETNAQRPSKMVRIGYLESGSAAPGTPYLEAFRRGLGDLGWIEGQNVAIEIRYAGGKFDQLPELAAELVRLKVDLIFASTTPGALAAKRATTTIPIVIGLVADPVKSGLVVSLGHPGGNITGWTHQGLDLRAKYLDLLKEAVPSATHIGTLMNPANPVHVASLKNLEAGAQALKVQLHPVWVQDPKDFEKSFSGLLQTGVQALAVLPEGMFIAYKDVIISLAARSRIPTLYGVTEFAEAGGLMAYGVHLPDMFRRGASFVDKILKGARPADIPVEQPTKFEFVINLGTAKALGLTIPTSVLARADRIIQ